MGKIIITKETKINALIECNDITEEAYNKLLAFIGTLNEEKEELKKEEAEEESKEEAGEKKPGRKKPDARLEKIKELYRDFKRNLGGYEIERMSAHEFLTKFPEYEGISLKSLGKNLTNMSRLFDIPYIEKTVKSSNGNSYAQRQFAIPVRKITYGSLIQKAREENRLSMSELAEYIGYPLYVVKQWEEDKATFTEEAKKLLKEALGNEIFDPIERRTNATH